MQLSLVMRRRDELSDLAGKRLGQVLLRSGFLGRHRVSPVAVTIKSTAAAIGEQVVGFLASRFVLERACELHGTAQPLSRR